MLTEKDIGKFKRLYTEQYRPQLESRHVIWLLEYLQNKPDATVVDVDNAGYAWGLKQLDGNITAAKILAGVGPEYIRPQRRKQADGLRGHLYEFVRARIERYGTCTRTDIMNSPFASLFNTEYHGRINALKNEMRLGKRHIVKPKGGHRKVRGTEYERRDREQIP